LTNPGNNFTFYCCFTVLERLFCGTNTGTLEIYPLSECSDSDVLSEKVASSSETSSNRKGYLPGLDEPKLLVNQELDIGHLKKLLLLTGFENVKPFFTANVPSCWIQIIQAQKDRKYPQHLQHQENDENLSTLSWRLQKTK